MRSTALLLFFFHAALVACGGSGATVPAVSEMNEAHGGDAVGPSDSPKPVIPGTRFDCETTKPFGGGVVHRLRFLVRDGALVIPIGDAAAIEVTPATSELAQLDEDPTSKHTGGRLVIRGAGKTELALFDNSELTRGYVKADGKYAEIFCAKDR